MPYRHITLVLIIFAGMVSCSIFRQSPKGDAMKAPADSSVQRVLYNDSIDNIIFNADDFRWYEMRGLTEFPDSTVTDDLLFGYRVKQPHGPVKDDVLSFIISDKDWYISDYPPVKQFFHPDIIFVFNRKSSGQAGMMVSFGTGEIAITDVRPVNESPDSVIQGNVRHYLMRDPRLMVRWLAGKLPDNTYYQTLLKL